MPGNTTSCNCNAEVIDLTADSDDEQIEAPRNNSGNFRRRNHRSRQTRKSNEIEVTKATLQTSCTVCLKKFEAIKSEGGQIVATDPCGHIFCRACISMTIRTRTKYFRDGTKFIHCPTCRMKLFLPPSILIHL